MGGEGMEEAPREGEEEAASAGSSFLRERGWRLGACVLVGVVVAALEPSFPAGETPFQPGAWLVLSVFVATIASFLLRPLEMGPSVLLALVVLSVIGGLSYTEAVGGFGDGTVWLVVAAFLLAHAVRATGLGRRISLLLVDRLGKTTLGLGYAIAGAELILGPVIPSNTARGGGVLAPIVNALARAVGSDPSNSPRKAGDYLVLVGAHCNLVTAAMFLTGMAANPLVSKAAKDVFGEEFGWGTWALGAIVPGLASLLLLPFVLHLLARPELKETGAARAEARRQLDAMGSWSRDELIMGVVFVALLLLWATSKSFFGLGPGHGLGTGLVAWIGVLALLLTGAQSWDDVSGNAAAWDALVWLGGLLCMATALKDKGVVAWFASLLEPVSVLSQSWMGPLAVVLVLAGVYFYSMYGFSMLTAHITALVGAFFAVAHAAGAPPLLTIALLAYFSNLCACTTNYSTGPVVIYFGLGYVAPTRWFRIGFVVSLVHMAVWLGLGLPWWKLLGWW